MLIDLRHLTQTHSLQIIGEREREREREREFEEINIGGIFFRGDCK